MNFEDDQPPNQAKSLMYFGLSLLTVCVIVAIALVLLLALSQPPTIFSNIVRGV